MIEGVPIAGLFVLACTLQDVDPLLGVPVAERHAASLVARDGKGVLIGWQELGGQGQVSVQRLADGKVLLTGLTFENTEEETWAVLVPSREDKRFEMEWLMYEHQATDGRRTVATWSKGYCDQLVADVRTE